MKNINYILKLNKVNPHGIWIHRTWITEISFYCRGIDNRKNNISLNCKNRNFFPNTNFFKL